MKNKIMAYTLLLSALTVSSAALAKNTCGGEIRFDKGKSSTMLKGKVAGYDICKYTFYAKKGQALTVNMGTSSRPVATVYSPVDHIMADDQPFVLPKSGKYELRIGMTRNDARKFPKHAQPFNAYFAISPSAGHKTGSNQDPVVASTSRIAADDVKLSGDYQAILPCADCRGIDTYLALYSDKTYTLSEKYIGKGDGSGFTQQGDWMRQGSVIILQPEQHNVDSSYWLISGGDLYRISQKEAGAAQPKVNPDYRLKYQSSRH